MCGARRGCSGVGRDARPTGCHVQEGTGPSLISGAVREDWGCEAYAVQACDVWGDC
jgi:hypothetical protein